MSVRGMKARNHPKQVAVRGPMDEVDDRATHPLDFAEISETWGPFTVDVAASAENRKCDRFYTRESDGLAQSWAGERVWCNPPFSDIGRWVAKAWAEHQHTELIVMLLPSNRTEQPWWQHMVEPFRDRPTSPLQVIFQPGRMRFLKPGQTAIHRHERPIFGCCLLIWYRSSTPWPLVYRSDAVTGGLFG